MTGDFDHRTDIYALGCVLYEMLAGTTPFTGSYQAIMARKAAEPAPGLRVLRETIPAHVEHAILRALARVPADRFSTAKDFSDALAGDPRALRLPRRPSRRRWIAAGAIGALALSGGTYVLVAGSPFTPASPALTATYQPLTTDPGVEWFPSVSPDGRWVVYAGQPRGNRDILLQSITGQTSINLTHDSPADDDQPAFSPDGERIAFRSARDGGGLFVMGRTGEQVRRVTDRGFRPTWSPDGLRIAFVTENVEMNAGNSEGISALWVVNVDGTGARQLIAGDAIQPAWSPNGHRIAYSKRLGAPAVGDIYTVDANGGEPTPVFTDPARDWSPAWSRDGRYLYFSSNQGGTMNLWRVAVDERTGRARGPREPVTTPATFLAHPSVAPDGRRVAYTSAHVTINIQRIGFDPVTGTVVGQPTAVTTGSRHFSSPDPSADGEWVTYYTLTQPEGDIYVSRSDGTQRRQLTADTAIDRLPRWSPDGRWIAMFSNRAGDLHLWRVRADGSGLARITRHRSAYIAWSPDGGRIATVIGGAQLGDTTAVVDAFAGDDQRPANLPPSPYGRFLPNAWSPDGEFLVGAIGAEGQVGHGIVVYSFRERRYEKLTDFGEWPVWLPDSRRILFVSGGNSFHVVDRRTGNVRRILEVDQDVIGPPRLSRNGRAAYYSRRVTESDIWLLTLTP